jgi:hypothetical protein
MMAESRACDAALHDEACYYMLRLRHAHSIDADDLERMFASQCATTWHCDPFHSDVRLNEALPRIHRFCKVARGRPHG